jgi:hypothetical protein
MTYGRPTFVFCRKTLPWRRVQILPPQPIWFPEIDAVNSLLGGRNLGPAVALLLNFTNGCHIFDQYYPNSVRKFTKKRMKTIGLRDL